MPSARGSLSVDAVAFDAYGTLFDLEALRAPAGADVFDGFLRRFIPWTWLATSAGDYRPLPEMAAAAFEAAGAPDPRGLADGLATLPAFPDVEKGLDHLAGRRLAVLSNGTAEGIRGLVEGAGIGERFEHLLSADAVRRFKPAPELYGLAPAAFGLDPARVLLVSSNEWDVAGAARAGLATAWLGRGRAPAWVLGIEADAVLGGIEDLGDLVRKARDPR